MRVNITKALQQTQCSDNNQNKSRMHILLVPEKAASEKKLKCIRRKQGSVISSNCHNSWFTKRQELLWTIVLHENTKKERKKEGKKDRQKERKTEKVSKKEKRKERKKERKKQERKKEKKRKWF